MKVQLCTDSTVEMICCWILRDLITTGFYCCTQLLTGHNISDCLGCQQQEMRPLSYLNPVEFHLQPSSAFERMFLQRFSAWSIDANPQDFI